MVASTGLTTGRTLGTGRIGADEGRSETAGRESRVALETSMTRTFGSERRGVRRPGRPRRVYAPPCAPPCARPGPPPGLGVSGGSPPRTFARRPRGLPTHKGTHPGPLRVLAVALATVVAG